jgi:hypothetical protein
MTLPIALETLGHRLASYCTLDADGTRGGILLGWDKDLVAVTNTVIGLFTISATVTVLLSNLSFKLSTCYGSRDATAKASRRCSMVDHW